MKLGYIRMPDLRPTRDDHTAIRTQLELADGLGVHVAYFPGQDPQGVVASQGVGADRIKIGLDTTAFGLLSPRQLERSVREANQRLGGRLYLGVAMGCEPVRTKNRADAQNFETMFSHEPWWVSGDVAAHFPMKQPCPKIIGLPAHGTAQEAGLAAARGYLPLTPSWLTPNDAARHWPAIVGGATSALRRACPSDWQLARSVVVHDDPAVIDAYVFGPNSPIRKYYSRLAQHGLGGVDIDAHLRRVVIAGTAENVANDILALQKTVGEIGTLYIIDHPGRDPDMTRNTMVRLAQDVMPMVIKTNVRPHKELERI